MMYYIYVKRTYIKSTCAKCLGEHKIKWDKYYRYYFMHLQKRGRGHICGEPECISGNLF